MQPERSVRLVRAVRQALLVRSGPLLRTERSAPWARPARMGRTVPLVPLLQTVRAVRQALLVRSGPLPRTERSVPWARWALPVRLACSALMA